MSIIQAHAQALLDLLAAAPGTVPLVVLDGAVPAGRTPPYVLAYLTVRTPSGEMPADSTSLDMDSDRIVLTAYLHCVGGNAAAARAVAGRVRGQLLNVVPVIAGRECWPIRQDDGQPPQRDETTGVLVMDQVDVYRLETLPA
ncbi:hypothetical protein GCM10027280_45370 [Micromonospora polyrhachis]|uniref:DUF3168 domain-containing protein n=1 Tax=Micromonospora polyrhachis TaxID=1282883 RepID=A0A7W7SQ93_9ACTN|nr:hypothetical protein [Micromonospora polyrhachis]MBB4958949.1 hypothetical protein [Micromonospora polyrhachis]